MDRADVGRVFDEVAELYDRVRPTYPPELVVALAAITGLNAGSSVLEVGCGTGLATRALAEVGCSITAVESGGAMVDVARRRLSGFADVTIEQSSFEAWEPQGRRFDVVVAAASWHWVDPAVSWPKAWEVLRPGGWLAFMGHVVVRRDGEEEVYAESADLHERFVPGNPAWGHPPLEDEVRAQVTVWGPPNEDRDGLFGATTVAWYPAVQHFDGQGFADLLRSHSMYRTLPDDVREPLLDAIAARIRERLGDHAIRRYLVVLRVGQRNESWRPHAVGSLDAVDRVGLCEGDRSGRIGQ